MLLSHAHEDRQRKDRICWANFVKFDAIDSPTEVKEAEATTDGRVAQAPPAEERTSTIAHWTIELLYWTIVIFYSCFCSV
jgi:hypothetical protein